MGAFNPLEPALLQQPFDEYFFRNMDEGHGYSLEHKAAIVQCLINALRQEDYDFAAILQES